MAAELRWILLALSLPLLAVIWWWTARRTGQAPGNAELRESTVGKPVESKPALDPRYTDSGDDERPEPEARDWGVPPFEPLSIHTAEFDRVPVLDGPMMVSVDAEPFTAFAVSPGAAAASTWVATADPTADATSDATTHAATHAATHATPFVRAAGSAAENSDRFATEAPPAANAAELQRIVTIRVCAVGDGRWSGSQLLAAFELHGLAFGRYQVFHRKHVDGRSLFCVASLIEPGTFDMGAMPGQEFRGVTLFAVLPGPISPLETIDELFATAHGLAEELSGVAQDARGVPLSPQRAAAMREDVARFQAMLLKE